MDNEEGQMEEGDEGEVVDAELVENRTDTEKFSDFTIGYDGEYTDRFFGEEENEEFSKEDEFSKLGESSETSEQQRCYLEYLDTIKEIDAQNQMVQDIKVQILQLCQEPCKTHSDMMEIKRLRDTMEEENISLKVLIDKAMKLQKKTHRRYRDIKLVTTFDEDQAAAYMNCVPFPSTRHDEQPSPRPCPSGKDADFKKLCCALAKIKVSGSRDKQLLQSILTDLSSLFNNNKQQQRPCPKRQQKQAVCSQRARPCKSKTKTPQPCSEEENQDVCQEQEEQPDPFLECLAKRKSKTDKIEKLKQCYVNLLQEYAKKDFELKEMEQRVKGFCAGPISSQSGKAGDGNTSLEAEINKLRLIESELKDEQIEFKCIMKEQSLSLEEYRQKYLVAQQKVEEQSVLLEKLNTNNKRIEKQINNEIKDIRAKFQEKLTELLHFPKLLENEQVKLAQCNKEREAIQEKLVLVCKELHTLKSSNASEPQDAECRPKLIKCQQELSELKKKLTQVELERDKHSETVSKLQAELSTLRSESAKIIARTKERTERIRQSQQEQINRIEKELEKCRAGTCKSIKEREDVICEMQNQLNTLSYSFDAAQKLIKTLRNHMLYVANEGGMYPLKC